MTSKLLAVVYDQDLPQFELMCFCLNKNWQGNKHITIIIQGNIQEIITSISQRYFSDDWIVDFTSCYPSKVTGTDLQQIDKILHSMDDRFQDVIVFDCKDFLLKPINESFFKKNNYYKITKISEYFDEFYPDVYSAMAPTIIKNKINAILNITPWMWNVQQLKRYWCYVTDQFGSLDNWSKFYPYSEIASYYFYTTELDESPVIKFDDDLFMPTGGIWDQDTLEDTLNVVENFSRYNPAVWKHHRRITDYSKTMITAMQLQKYDIPVDIINKWVESKHNLRS